MVKATPQPLYPRERDPVSIVLEVGGRMGLRTGLEGCEKPHPPRNYFLCVLSVLLCPDCRGFAFYAYCTTQTSLPPARFEHVISASERSQAFALDR